jgi:hypothetical protein
MCAFEEEIKKNLNQKKHVIKVLFTGRWIVICAIHRWIVLFRQIEWNYGNSIVMQYNLYRKKYEKFNNSKYVNTTR